MDCVYTYLECRAKVDRDPVLRHIMSADEKDVEEFEAQDGKKSGMCVQSVHRVMRDK